MVNTDTNGGENWVEPPGLLNNATEKQRESAYAFYLKESNLIAYTHPGAPIHDPGWDNPAPTK